MSAEPVRVTHLATVDREGGAARSAFRLHQALRERGHDSQMVVNRATVHDGHVTAANFAGTHDDYFWSNVQVRAIDARRSSLSNTYFSLGAPGWEPRGQGIPAEKVRSAQVIHLHWVAGFQSPMSVAYLQTLPMPLVWTLHDQRPFTGGCHFSAGCTGYETDCAFCPQLTEAAAGNAGAILQRSIAHIDPSRLTVIAPSRWLAGCASRSTLFRQADVRIIPYGLETDIFRPLDRAECRRKLGLPEDALILLFGADYGAELRKGGQLLLEALAQCATDSSFAAKVAARRVVLAAFGRPITESTDQTVPIHSVGYIKDDQRMAELYSAADVFILPTLEDNLPNTMLESMSCGTPVLAFNTGGVPDAVEHGRNGLLTAERTVSSLANAILRLPDRNVLRTMGELARATIEKNFSNRAQAAAYENLYGQLLQKPRRPSVPRLATKRDAFDALALETFSAAIAEHAQTFSLKAVTKVEKRLHRKARQRLERAVADQSMTAERFRHRYRRELEAFRVLPNTRWKKMLWSLLFSLK